MVERHERPLAWPACHLRLSLSADRLVPDRTGHAADDGRIWIVPPGSSSPTAAQNLGALRATRPVDDPVPDDVRRPVVLAHVDLVLVPVPNGRAHVEPAFETIHERHRPAVRRVDLAGSAQRVADEAFVGLLVGRIRMPAVRLPGTRVGQLLVVGIARRARQLRHIGRLENRPGHRNHGSADRRRPRKQKPASTWSEPFVRGSTSKVSASSASPGVDTGSAVASRTAAPRSGARLWRWPPARARPAAAAR